MTNTASAAVQDAYAGLKKLILPWVRDEGRLALEADETESDVWQARLGEELTASGAADDDKILQAAKRLLVLADPAKAATRNITVGTNYGAVGDFAGPVTISSGPSVPPAPPATG